MIKWSIVVQYSGHWARDPCRLTIQVAVSFKIFFSIHSYSLERLHVSAQNVIKCLEFAILCINDLSQQKSVCYDLTTTKNCPYSHLPINLNLSGIWESHSLLLWTYLLFISYRKVLVACYIVKFLTDNGQLLLTCILLDIQEFWKLHCATKIDNNCVPALILWM